MKLNDAYVWSVILGVLFAVVTMFVSTPPMTRVFSTISGPIAGVKKTKDGQENIPYFNGVFCLWALYALCGFIFAYTGGTIGVSMEEWKPEYTRNHMVWGFSTGVLVMALARISAVYISSSLAYYLQLLTIGVLGLVTFKLIQDFNYITRLFDEFIRPSGGYFVAFAGMTSLFTFASVEVGIWLCKSSQSANMVPCSLLRERVEQYRTVQQVFWPEDITKFTDQTINREISKEGLRELCWLTNTAPPTHIDTMIKAVENWVISKGESSNVSKYTTDILRSNVKVFVTSEQGREELNKYPFLEEIRFHPSPIRTRLLIINAKHAIVHLPIPFTGDNDEQSNCAMLVSSPLFVQSLREEFDALWENYELLSPIDKFTELIIKDKMEQFKIAQIIYEAHHPISLNLIMNKLNSNPNLEVSAVRESIEELKEIGLVREIENKYAPVRFTRTCRISDIFRRFNFD